MKNFLNIVFVRTLYIILFASIQIASIVIVFCFLKDKFAYFYAICIIVSAISALQIINEHQNLEYKIAWLIPILLVPIFGGLLYLIFGHYHISNMEKQVLAEIESNYDSIFQNSESAFKKLEEENKDAALQSKYIINTAKFLPYDNTKTEYFSIGEEMFGSMLDELAKAKSYIFLEYFIIKKGVMWDSILEILTVKAKLGVDVRLIYDDFGCMYTLPNNYEKHLREKGLKVSVFHKFNSILDPRFNNRDHRKICIIDGKVAFNGGINLADEYINEKLKHGHWKDTGIKIEGPAVWNLIVMFLYMWGYSTKNCVDLNDYILDYDSIPEDEGFVQPFADSPHDEDDIGKTVYLNMISRAKKYVHITTPYLIIDSDMMLALCNAAKSGVDIKIITPHIGDNRFVHSLSRSYYKELINSGVSVYEYTPGFIHAKSFVSDDIYGVVGTINLDYRSMFLHYECGTWMYKTKAVSQLSSDFNETLLKCEKITTENISESKGFKKLLISILRVFSPLI